LISAVIITKDEEVNILNCLQSISWIADIHVLDSFSSDKTVEIAKKYGAKIQKRKFDDYATHRNAALRSNFQFPWVLILDADERVTPDLEKEIKHFVCGVGEGYSACRVQRRDYFDGTWLKRSQISPYFVRLVRPEKVFYQRAVNEVLVVDGTIKDLTCHLDHFPFSKGVFHWVEKHNKYSTLEAEVLTDRVWNKKFRVRDLFARDFNVRRVAQKHLFYRLPLRPYIKLFYMLFVRGALLDGRSGIHYSLLQFFYEYMISLKIKEREESISTDP